ncbi:AraC family transcriptional regulator [Leptospira perolatii]|uniref:AraC family transcriptional regulator n=1 Tax=Leptospira perolatii TaxID=2023191 RepID=A0A2M9ZQC8_9LEPT|nr:helix-turn-helix domain-containing protein [Leptospira perolatii]PJZ70436.1 AraC family transcriptional regulator [Leptospira perolatii]PJZ74272.1 AraC family transcriptional regulator [Leptospira perolatii]
MEWVHAGLISVIQFGAGISFLYAILEMSRQSAANRSMVAIAVFTGTILLRYSWYLNESLLRIPYLFIYLYTTIVLVGPLVFVFVQKRLQNPDEESASGKFERRYWIHFVPCILFFIGESLFFIQEQDQLRDLIQRDSIEFRLDWLHLAALIASIHVSVYSLACLYLYHKVSKKYEIYEIKLIWVVLLLPVFSNALIGPAFFMKSRLLFEIGASCIAIIVLLMFVVRERHPGLLSELSAVIQSVKYQNTPLLPSDVEAANSKLKNIMEQQAFYRDSELRLIDLAAGLGLSVHQTSRYLNEVHQMTFYELVNYYRIKEACDLLIYDPKKTVLEIGYEVGFNSKSTFNSQFVKATGMSPAIYRKNRISEKESDSFS